MIIRPTEFHRLDFQNRGCVGVTSGCFDLLHFYHLQYLEKCRALCDFLIVGVDDDATIQTNKGKPPVIGQHQRTMMVEALRCVDAAWTMTSLDEFHFLATRAHAVFRNGTSVYGKHIRPTLTGKMVIIPDIEEITSTTAIITKIRNTEKSGPGRAV